MNDKILKKGLVAFTVFLFIGVGVLPNITAENLYLTKEEFGTEEKNIPPNLEGIFKKLYIRTHGRIFFSEIIRYFLYDERPELSIGIRILNFHKINVAIEVYVKIIGTRGNIVIFDDLFSPIECEPGDGPGIAIGAFEVYNYTYGPFDVIVEVHIQETNKDIKVIFHGFVFEIGTIIFNSWGKSIE